MGANNPLATPEAYPVAFLSAIRDGAGVIYAADLPWSPISSAKRFRICLALIRRLPGHPLYDQARRRWAVQTSATALVVSVVQSAKGEQSLTAHLIGRALGRN